MHQGQVDSQVKQLQRIQENIFESDLMLVTHFCHGACYQLLLHHSHSSVPAAGLEYAVVQAEPPRVRWS